MFFPHFVSIGWQWTVQGELRISVDDSKTWANNDAKVGWLKVDTNLIEKVIWVLSTDEMQQ